MKIIAALGLFVVTAFAEIIGCYLPYIWLKQGRSPLYLIPAAASLGLFVWLLSLHPDATGRTYAAYGGIYIAAAIFWLWLWEGQVPTSRDLLGAALVVLGAVVILSQQFPAK